MTPFAKAFAYLIGNESANYVNDPNDAGGPTKYGITLKSYEDFAGCPITTGQIACLSELEAREFYYSRYWVKFGFDRISVLPSQIAVFDTFVLYGDYTTTRMLQGALGFVNRDGIMGPQTIAALNQDEPKVFLGWFCDRIRCHIESIVHKNSKLVKFKAGWTNRADRLLTIPVWLAEIDA